MKASPISRSAAINSKFTQLYYTNTYEATKTQLLLVSQWHSKNIGDKLLGVDEFFECKKKFKSLLDF